jgi:hypothetical protein
MVESPRWLWIKGKPKECIKRLKVIARMNKTKLEEDTEQEILSSPPINKDQALGPLSLFSGRKIAMNTILILYLW